MPASAPSSHRARRWRRGRGEGAVFLIGAGAFWQTANARDLRLPQRCRLAAEPRNRCLIPLTEFAEWTSDKHDLGDGKPPVKGNGLTMVTYDPNELVAPIHPKAMITILHPDRWDRWLRGSYEDVVDMQRPYPAGEMSARGPVFATRSGPSMR